MKSVLYSSGEIAGSGTTYFNVLCPVLNGSSVEETSGACPISAAGTLRNLQIHLNDAVTITSKTFTLRKNGADTAITVTFLTGESDKSDLVNSVSVSSGDVLALREDIVGGNQTCYGQIRLEFEATAAKTTVYGFGTGNNMSNAVATNFIAVLGGTWNVGGAASDASIKSIVGAAGTVTNIYLRIPTAPTAGKNWIAVLAKNGVLQDGSGGTPNTTVTIADAATTGNASFSLSVAAADYLSLNVSDTGNPPNTPMHGCVTFVATNADERPVCGNSRDPLTGATTTEFNTPHGGDVVWTSNAATAMQRGAATSLILGGFHAEINAAAGASKGFIFTLVKNGVDTTQTVTISGATDTSATCTAASVTIADGDTWVIKAVPTGSPPNNLTAKTTFFYTALATTPDPVTDPPGGGVVDAGTDPTTGVDLCGGAVPLAWDEITPAGSSTTYRYAKVPINIDDTPKTPRVLSFGRLTRSLSGPDGIFRGTSGTAVYADTDRVLRGLEASDSLVNARISRYMSTEAAMRARVIAPTTANAPRRVFDGVVTDTEPLGGLEFQVQFADYFSALLEEFAANHTFPQRTFTVADFPNLGNDPLDPSSPGNPALIGKPVPIGYGLLSDEAYTPSVCVVPAHYVGKRTVNGFAWDEYVFFCHSPGGAVLSISGELVGVRQKYPLSMEGVDFIIPGHSGWNTHTGSTAVYRDYNGNRYGTFFARGPHSDAARLGQVPFTLNVPGVDDVGDGTGDMIDGLYLQILHLFVNFLFGNYASGAWLLPPVVPGDLYSRIKTSTFPTLQTYSETLLTGGFLGAFMIGADLETKTFTEVLQEAAISGAFKYGLNADGQLVAIMSDPNATLNRTIIDVTDILKETFRARRRRDQIGNTIVYRYARRYQRDETFTVADGERLPGANAVPSSPDWGGEYTKDTTPAVDATSVTKYGTRIADRSYSMVRDSDTADALAAYELARLKNAPSVASFEERLCGTNTDLGSRDTITHFEGISGSGWSARSMQCEEHTIDADQMTVDKEYVDLTGLPA